ncbi:hypothetical protein DPMN_121830 [Dreissena polymorpha]|uniref:Uncharacterized protein n=1 Tax=Dreissena polymorpha TaxID=45954 RepID=A0A9D4JPX6_DREPO|nr:hypothetical protein DPMN_121830 [Dreissena polymorpha]
MIRQTEWQSWAWNFKRQLRINEHPSCSGQLPSPVETEKMILFQLQTGHNRPNHHTDTRDSYSYHLQSAPVEKATKWLNKSFRNAGTTKQ